MGQKTSGIYSLLSNPFIYSLSQKISGGTAFRRAIVKKFINKNGVNVLDIGCGPAEFLDNMPKVKYFGYDLNPLYINYAKKKYRTKGKFFCRKFTSRDLKKLPKFDHVLLLSVLHHLKDEEIKKLIILVKKKLKKKGNIISVDPVLVHKQNIIEKFLIKIDRGVNIKNKIGYTAIIKKYFKKRKIKIYHQKFFPFTWIVMSCRN